MAYSWVDIQKVILEFYYAPHLLVFHQFVMTWLLWRFASGAPTGVITDNEQK